MWALNSPTRNGESPVLEGGFLTIGPPAKFLFCLCLKPYFVVAVQLLSHVQLFVTPWTAACQASRSFTVSWSLLKLMSIESVMPSSCLMPCRPVLLLPSIFPSISVFFWWVFSNELVTSGGQSVSHTLLWGQKDEVNCLKCFHVYLISLNVFASVITDEWPLSWKVTCCDSLVFLVFVHMSWLRDRNMHLHNRVVWMLPCNALPIRSTHLGSQKVDDFSLKF